MNPKNDLDFGSVSSKRVEAIISKLKRDKEVPADESVEIPFTFLIISCFPTLWETFEENIKKVHQEGYIDGYNYGHEEYRERFLEEMKKWTKKISQM